MHARQTRLRALPARAPPWLDTFDEPLLEWRRLFSELFGTFLLGMFWKRTSAHSGFWGLLCGILAAVAHYTLYHYHYITYPSDMAANFYQAIWAFVVCIVVTVVVTFFTQPRKESELVGLVYSLTPRPKMSDLPWYDRPGILAIGILGLCTVLNIIFW